MRFSSAAPRVEPRRPSSLLALTFLAAIAGPLAACVTPDPATPAGQGGGDNRARQVDFQHEDCAPNGDSKTVDVNGDSRPDIVHVMKDGREACRIVDLNFDGAVDVYIFYDDKGAERRREADFDRDGRPDQVSLYQGGQLTEHQRETNFDDKIDTWDYYTAGALTRRERDSDGDAIIDQWWTFYDPARPRCATVATDRNADGKPDADSQVDLCGTGYVTPSVATAPPGLAPGATAAPSTSPAPPAGGAVTPVAAPASGSPAPSASPSPAPVAPAPVQNP